MFGKGGGALSTWIKELCELVFIQTIQAFLYAIAISMIVDINKDNLVDANDRNIALGLICVVIFTAIFKVEDIVRKVFGFGPTKADHGHALASLAKTQMAFAVGKRVFDNGRKLIGGAGRLGKGAAASIAAKANRRQQLQQNEENYNRRKALYEGGDNANDPKTATGTALPVSRRAKLESERASEAKKLNELRKKKLEISKNGGNTSSITDQIDAQKKKVSDLDTRINRLPKDDVNSSGSDTTAVISPAVSGSKASGTSDIRSKEKMLDLQERYEARKKEIEDNYKEAEKKNRSMRSEGRRMMAKGVLETGGAIVGGTAGMIIGGADGDIGEALRAGTAGMGIGDALGSGAVDLGTAPIDMGRSIRNELKGVKKSYDKEVKAFEKEYDRMLQGVYKDLDEVQASALRKAANKGARGRAKLDITPNMNINVDMKHVNKAIDKANREIKLKGGKEIAKLKSNVEDI